MSGSGAFDLLEHIHTRTAVQRTIDGAFADAMHTVEERCCEWNDTELGESPDADTHAADYVAFSLSVQRTVREAMLTDGVLAGVTAVRREQDWPYGDRNDIVTMILEAALDTVFGPENRIITDGEEGQA